MAVKNRQNGSFLPPFWRNVFLLGKNRCNFVNERAKFLSKKMAKPTLKISCEAVNNQAVIRIDGNICGWNNSSESFRAAVDKMVSNGIADASIYINSGGGSCFEANEIANEIKKFKGNITAKLGALCASAATYIASSCSFVSAASNINYMIHKPLMDAFGNSTEIESGLKVLRNLEANYLKVYMAKTGLSEQELTTMWASDYWMNGEEAKAKGFIDEVDGESQITEEDIMAIKASGYKNLPNITATIQPKNDNQMKQLLISALALVATATEAEVLASVENYKAKALRTDALEAELKELKRKTNEDKVNAVLAKAKADKKFTAIQESFFRKSLDTDFEATVALLDSMPAVVALSSEINKGSVSGVDRSKWTYADYQEKDPAALEALAKDDEATFKALAEAHYNIKL